MEEAQLELQNALTTTFLANLAFLSEYDNELYHRVDELSRMIENGTYKERYGLEFNMQDGDFDIYDIVNDKYLYNKSPKKFNDNLVRKIDFDEKSSIFDLPTQFLYKFQEKIDRTNRFNFESSNQFYALTFNDTWEYASSTGDFLLNRKKRFKRINKFIFLGTLLGRHIPRIADKVDARMYLILEKNLEIFRLSLFTVDYTVLGNKGAIFSIMDNKEKTQTKIMSFLKLNYVENYLLKLSITNINIEEYIDSILNAMLILKPIAYDYNRMLYSNINRATKYVKEGYKILRFDKIKQKFNFLKDTTVLYLAAGPSLDESINWIKKNQDKFFIVTIGAAYKKLLANNIHIDMITTLDESDILSYIQFDDKSVAKISKDTIILASNITNERVLKKFNQDNLILYEVFTLIHKENFRLDGFSIGEITLDILLQLNPNKIYLVGLDLALNQETGDSHSKGSNSSISKLNLNAEQNRNTFSSTQSLIKVKGNHCETVFTTPLFFSSINSTNSKLLKKDNNLQIYNLSSHGAYFETTIPTKIEDIKIEDINDKDIKNSDFLSLLKRYSVKKVSNKTKIEIKKDIESVKEIFEILENIESKDYKKFEDLFKDMKLILDKSSQNSYQIILNYFQMMMPYLFYHFNDIKIKNESKKSEKIKLVFVKQIKYLFNDYILCLERVL